MQNNKNGIPVYTPGKKNKRQRIKPEFELGKRKFALISDEADVEIIVPDFSPVIELMISDGWKEIKFSQKEKNAAYSKRNKRYS